MNWHDAEELRAESERLRADAWLDEHYPTPDEEFVLDEDDDEPEYDEGPQPGDLIFTWGGREPYRYFSGADES